MAQRKMESIGDFRKDFNTGGKPLGGPASVIGGDGRERTLGATPKLPDRETTIPAGRGSYPSGKSVTVRKTMRSVTRKAPRGGSR